MNSCSERCNQSGFTLVEVLVSLSILALIGVGATALGIGGVVSIKDTVSETTGGAVAVDLVAMTFAGDVQGSSGIGAECAPAAGGAHLVTLAQTDPGRPTVEYRSAVVDDPADDSRGDDTHNLLRVLCTQVARSAAEKSAAAEPDPKATGSTRTVLEDLDAVPEFSCDGKDCEPGSASRTIVLSVSPEASEPYELAASRRTSSVAPGEAPVPPTPEFDGRLLLLGNALQLNITGSSQLAVSGDALVNARSKGDAVVLTGNPRMFVTETFAIQAGGTCKGCDKFADNQPKSFDEPLQDPFAKLAPPSYEGMPTRTDCPITDGVRVCLPGIYPETFPPRPGGVSKYRLEPGIYLVANGISMTYETLSGEGVMFYNPKAATNLGGSSRTELTPPDHGTWAGVLFHQPASNTNAVKVSGNARLVAPGSVLHAPGAALDVSGSASVELLQVVTGRLDLTGNTRATVGKT